LKYKNLKNNLTINSNPNYIALDIELECRIIARNNNVKLNEHNKYDFEHKIIKNNENHFIFNTELIEKDIIKEKYSLHDLEHKITKNDANYFIFNIQSVYKNIKFNSIKPFNIVNKIYLVV